MKMNEESSQDISEKNLINFSKMRMVMTYLNYTKRNKRDLNF
jgi:hypothetical protein